MGIDWFYKLLVISINVDRRRKLWVSIGSTKLLVIPFINVEKYLLI
jgi:hypothetical protein